MVFMQNKAPVGTAARCCCLIADIRSKWIALENEITLMIMQRERSCECGESCWYPVPFVLRLLLLVLLPYTFIACDGAASAAAATPQLHPRLHRAL